MGGEQVNTYEELKEWLVSDLGRISDLKQLREYSQAFLKKINAQEVDDKIFIQHVVRPMQSALEIIDSQHLDDGVKIDHVNQVFKNIFIDVFFKEEHYSDRLTALSSLSNYEAEVVSRLKSPNPLPTLDAIFTLSHDPRGLSQVERAAILVDAAIKIFSRLKKEKEARFGSRSLTWKDQSPYYANTVIIAEHGNTLTEPLFDSRHITVLINGQAYNVPIIMDENKALSVREIKNAFENIISDYKLGRHYDALGSTTAAPRELCYEARKKLETRAENSRLFQSIDHSLFVVCLDYAPSLSEDREWQLKRLFCNYSNRWYGSTQIIVGPDGEAAILGSYSRGDNVSSFVPLIDAIAALAVKTSVDSGTVASEIQLQARKLEFDIKPGELSELAKQAAPYFHDKRSLFKLGVGVSFFRERGLNPNAAVQLLIMLAAREMDAQKKFPIYKQAMVVIDDESTGSALDWVFIPTHKVRKFLDEVDKNKLNDVELFALFKEAVDEYAETVKKTNDGWSPTFFLRKPEGELYDALCHFFVTVGNSFEGAYAGYLFRPARIAGSMDILTSFHRLPKSITLLGRPGGTLEAVEKFGAHIAYSRKDIEFSWMPNVASDINLTELDSVLKKWVAYIDRISQKSVVENQ